MHWTSKELQTRILTINSCAQAVIGVPLTSFDNPSGQWTIDCWIKTPLPAVKQWHTLAKGIADSQVIFAPDQESELLTATYGGVKGEGNVGSVTKDDKPYGGQYPEPGQVENWVGGDGKKLVTKTGIPTHNDEPLAQTYFTTLQG